MELSVFKLAKFAGHKFVLQKQAFLALLRLLIGLSRHLPFYFLNVVFKEFHLVEHLGHQVDEVQRWVEASLHVNRLRHPVAGNVQSHLTFEVGALICGLQCGFQVFMWINSHSWLNNRVNKHIFSVRVAVRYFFIRLFSLDVKNLLLEFRERKVLEVGD